MASTSSHRELHHRSSDGIDVWLMWDPGTDSVSVRVHDAKAGSRLRDPGHGAVTARWTSSTTRSRTPPELAWAA